MENSWAFELALFKATPPVPPCKHKLHGVQLKKTQWALFYRLAKQNSIVDKQRRTVNLYAEHSKYSLRYNLSITFISL